MKIPESFKDRILFKESRSAYTEPPKVEVLPQESVCNNCNKEVINKREEFRKTKYGWTTRCVNCNKYQNPVTGEFDMSSQAVRNYWAAKTKDK